RDMILAGEFGLGDRLIEERLTERLGISRPPLREAFRLLQREGLITTVPRRGAIVTPLTPEDVWEIQTLRAALDRTAITLGVPVRVPSRLQACREAFARMESAAAAQDWARLARAGWEFHLALASLPGHRRLEEAYRTLALQMRLYMAMNTRIRHLQNAETSEEHVERHRRLLRLIEAGDRQAVIDELGVHGDRTYQDSLQPRSARRGRDGRRPRSER
ncbi:MAG: GntR family transcriptional regulator, partial [Candidatus Dormiibacterota bacterium]